MRQAHTAHAEPARGPGHVEGLPGSDHRRGVLDRRGWRAPHRAFLRRDRRADEGLGADDGHRVRAHHKGHHRRGAGAAAVPERFGVEAEIT